MEKNYKSLFGQILFSEPSAELAGRVLARIAQVERRRARGRVFVMGSITIVSLASLFPAVSYLMNELSLSGFYQYSSLIFSDSSSVLPYWKEFVLTLAESLPLLTLTILLTLLLTFLGSLRQTARDFVPAFLATE